MCSNNSFAKSLTNSFLSFASLSASTDVHVPDEKISIDATVQQPELPADHYPTGDFSKLQLIT